MAHTLAAGHANRAIPHGHAYARREPEKTALYQVFHRHLPGFERMWSDADSGNCLPRHVTEELQKFLTCGILSHGFAQMHCDACFKRPATNGIWWLSVARVVDSVRVAWGDA